MNKKTFTFEGYTYAQTEPLNRVRHFLFLTFILLFSVSLSAQDPCNPDDIPPVAVCQDLTIALTDIGTVTLVSEDYDNGSSDACGDLGSLLADQLIFSCEDIGEVIVNLTVSDASDNLSTCQSIVTVNEGDNPDADCICYADAVVSSNSVNCVPRNPDFALGAPDFLRVPNINRYYSMGDIGSSLVLAFTDNALINDGTNAPDLFVYEIGPAVEETNLWLKPADAATATALMEIPLTPDADGFYFFGQIEGATRTVDIDELSTGVAGGTYVFNQVKFINPTAENCSTLTGPDIDAVCALSTINCVDMDGDGFTDCAGDCDDNDATIYPGAPGPQIVNCWDDFQLDSELCEFVNVGTEALVPTITIDNPVLCIGESVSFTIQGSPGINYNGSYEGLGDNFSVTSNENGIATFTAPVPASPGIHTATIFNYNYGFCSIGVVINGDYEVLNPTEPVAENCWDDFVFDNENCTYVNQGEQPEEPIAVNCWDDFQFDTMTCSWINMGSEALAPVFTIDNPELCDGEVVSFTIQGSPFVRYIGSYEPGSPAPGGPNFDITADANGTATFTAPATPFQQFSTATIFSIRYGDCIEGVSIPVTYQVCEQPTIVVCVGLIGNVPDPQLSDDQDGDGIADNCSLTICSGDQPAWKAVSSLTSGPTDFHSSSTHQNNPDLIGDGSGGGQLIAAGGFYSSFPPGPIINTSSVVQCYETRFWAGNADCGPQTNDPVNGCRGDFVAVTICVEPEPVQPPAVNCWDDFIIDSETCTYVNQGTQPEQPPVVNCWDDFQFDTMTCSWVNMGSEPVTPTIFMMLEEYCFDDLLNVQVTGEPNSQYSVRYVGPGLNNSTAVFTGTTGIGFVGVFTNNNGTNAQPGDYIVFIEKIVLPNCDIPYTGIVDDFVVVPTPQAVCQDISIDLIPLAGGVDTIIITPTDIDNGSGNNTPCPIASMTLDVTVFGCSDTGDNTVTLTVTDESGNNSSCTAIVTVNDITPPALACESTLTVALDANGLTRIISDTEMVISLFDRCEADESSLTLSQNQFDCTEIGNNLVGITGSDVSGNSSTCSPTIIVVDDLAPTASCQDITITLDANGAASIVADDIDNGSADNCSVSLSASTENFDCSNVGDNTVTLTVTDSSGNTDMCDATVTVSSIDADGDGSSLCDGDCNDNDATIFPGAPELCDGLDNNCDGLEDNLNLAFNRPSDASVLVGHLGTVPANAFDGDPATEWNSGIHPVQWISVDLGMSYPIGLMKLFVEQTPSPAATVHNIFFSEDGINWGSPVDVISKVTTNGETLLRPFTGQTARYIKVETTVSPSWVAWDEIEVYELGQTIYFADTDGDGFGNPEVCMVACSQPAGFVTDNTDCNDDNATIFPGAPEICGNDIDENCDGNIDENCEIYCPSMGQSTEYEWIESIAVNGIQNISGNDSGYGDYTGIILPISTGSNSLTLTPGFAGNSYREYWVVSIDYNQNGVFDSNEYAYYNSSFGTINANFNVPLTALTGETRMRIAMRYGGWPYPCDIFDNGEVEDYTVNITFCDNVTDGGHIGDDEVLCDGNNDPAEIISNTDASGGSGGAIEYVWLKNTTTSTPPTTTNMNGWVEIPNTNSPNYDPASISETTWFIRCARRNGCGIYLGESNIIEKTVQAVCTPDYCESYGESTQYEWIKKVKLGSINNWSGNNNGYADFTNHSTDLYPGQNKTIQLKPGFSNGAYLECWSVFVDWNQDGDFDDAGETETQTSGYGNRYRNISVPYNAASGPTRMRVAMKYGNAYPTACEVFGSGEVEDYTINVIGSQNLISNTNDELQLEAALELMKVNLTWVNNTGDKNDYFIIEKSMDGVVFSAMKTVENDNNEAQAAIYKNSDETPVEGFNYYRIKLILDDGTLMYSNIKQVELTYNPHEISLFPNPAENEIFVNATEFEGMNAKIFISSATGQILQHRQLDEIPGTAIRLPVSELKEGLYFMNIKVEGFRAVTKRFVVARSGK